MRKRISCKVIRTIPLNSSIDEVDSTSRPNVKPPKIDNSTGTPNTNRFAWETTTDPGVKDFGKSVIYTERLNITRIPTDNGFTAQRINFYA
jgi:hypothetical protein